MSTEQERIDIDDAIEHCIRAREKLDGRCSFRTRVLIDMLLLELGKELARVMEGHEHSSAGH